jgi:hypothetical protein
MFASCLHGDLGFEKYFLDFGEYFNAELVLSQYKELEGNPIHHSDAAFNEDKKKWSNGLNRMRLTDNTKGASCATCLMSQHKGSWFRRAAQLVLSSQLP